jgi:rhamnulokinase
VNRNARIVAADLGASGGKVFAGEFRDGAFALREVHRFSHEAVTFHVPDRDGRLEERTFWDDVLLYANIVQGLKAYRREAGQELDSIGIDTWGADGIFVDADGVPLGRVYAYRDHRLDRMCDEVKARIGAARIYELTGVHFWPFNISNQLLWWAEHRPSLMKKGVRFLPVPTLFTWYLGGRIAVDSTWASVTQLMDCRKRRWSREILKALGVPVRVMPEIVAPGEVVGRLSRPLAESTGLPEAKLIAVASHDTASAFAAAPVVNPSSALVISSGTWSLVGKLIRRPITTPEAMAANISNEGGIGSIRFLKNCMGTWLVQELRRAWRDRDCREMAWDEMNALSERGKPFAAFLEPNDASFYNPANMEEAIVAFCRKTGQEPPGDRGTMLRSVYESLALKYRAVGEQIAAVSGRPNRVVHIVGGGSRNELLNQLTANACGMTVVAGPEEATAIGNAMVQALGLRVISGMGDAQELIRAAFPIREYRPKDRAAWDAAYQRFKKVAKE